MDHKNMTTFKGTPMEDIIKNLPEIKQGYNIANIITFANQGTMDSRKIRHRCVLCGKPTSIDDSISNRGRLLIDIACVYRYFDGDYAAASMWNGGLKNE